MLAFDRDSTKWPSTLRQIADVRKHNAFGTIDVIQSDQTPWFQLDTGMTENEQSCHQRTANCQVHKNAFSDIDVIYLGQTLWFHFNACNWQRFINKVAINPTSCCVHKNNAFSNIDVIQSGHAFLVQLDACIWQRLAINPFMAILQVPSMVRMLSQWFWTRPTNKAHLQWRPHYFHIRPTVDRPQRHHPHHEA